MKRCLALLLAAVCFSQCLCTQVSAGGPEQPFKGCIALTFDDGPSGPVTGKLLDALSARGVKVTFFVCAYRVRQYPDMLCRAAGEGHEIGLHSCCHSYMHRMPRAEVAEDITNCMQAVSECCGVRPRLFRPPGGLYSGELLAAAKDAQLSVILWSVDPQDWDPKNKSSIVSSVVNNVRPGSVILMHDLYNHSVTAAAEIIDRLQKEGYVFCTVSELARFYGAELSPGSVYGNFPPSS